MKTHILLLILPALLFANDVKGGEPVKVAVMQIAEADHLVKAPNLDLAKAYCDKAKVSCVIVPLPTTRAFTELSANRVQFLLSLEHEPSTPAPTKVAKKDSAPIIVISKKELHGCEELNTMTLAAFRNVYYAKKLMVKCPGLKITWTSTYPQAMQMYQRGRVQGVVGVARNFEQKQSFVTLQPDDIKSQVGVEDVWLFGNDVSKNSTEALQFRSLIPD